MMNRRKYFAFLMLLAVAFLMHVQMRNVPDECTRAYRNNVLRSAPDSLFQGENAVFASSGNCDNCHGLDPAGLASVDGEGGDINLVDDWSSSMMANSAKDPYWRAAVSREVLKFPQFQTEIENTCTKCHAPLGHFAAIMTGAENYSIYEMLADSVALDGVSCLACHRQLPQPEIANHTGSLQFNPLKIAYGPFESPLISPMAAATGYNPEYSLHTLDSKLCAGCHSLITETVDMEGQFTGNQFVEQATWHEWLNSSYPASNTSCQSCHLPQQKGTGVVLAAGYPTPPRQPFGLHALAGGNSLMLDILSQNRDTLGIYASQSQFNETINATIANLQTNSLLLTLPQVSRTYDTLFADVKLKNITGHKLPSGYPSRRITIHAVATDSLGNELFRSGGFDDGFHFIEEDLNFEPHYNVISQEDQVQIYEMAMGNVLGQRTTILNQGASHLKDNRLVPLGHSSSGALGDTTEIVLNGVNDSDFNFDPNEGSGTDILHFHIPLNGFTGTVHFSVKAYYQSVPPFWAESLFEDDTPEINLFEEMYNASDRLPVLMKSANTSLSPYVGLDEWEKLPLAKIIHAHSGVISFQANHILQVDLYDITGNLLLVKTFNSGIQSIDKVLSTGTYIICFTDKKGSSQIEKVMVK
jgi:hypothetical protein